MGEMVKSGRRSFLFSNLSTAITAFYVGCSSKVEVSARDNPETHQKVGICG